MRLYRRAILIYIVSIVTPACVLLWLGIQSFERQRQALASLAAEKLEAELETRMRPAAADALDQNALDQISDRRDHPIAKYFFAIEHGMVVRPALNAPPRQPVPQE